MKNKLNKKILRYNKNIDVYVIRVSNKGLPIMSKPCKACTEMLKIGGYGKVIYSTDTGFNIEKIKNLETSHKSKINKVLGIL